MKYHAAQFRAARAALGLGLREVAAELRVSFRTLSQIEQPDADKTDPTEEALARIVAFYKSRGITFLAGTAQGPGIRFHIG